MPMPRVVLLPTAASLHPAGTDTPSPMGERLHTATSGTVWIGEGTDPYLWPR
jgi:hypothetical protein